jgi:methylmalonyl-CoA epimerase
VSLQGIDHVAVAVRSLEVAIPRYEELLQRTAHRITVEEQGVRVAVFDFGDTRLELLEPLNERSGLRSFLEEEGEGLHHVAVRTEDVSGELDRLEDREEIACIDSSPRQGAEGYKIAFLHPESFHGALLELAQPPS